MVSENSTSRTKSFTKGSLKTTFSMAGAYLPNTQESSDKENMTGMEFISNSETKTKTI